MSRSADNPSAFVTAKYDIRALDEPARRPRCRVRSVRTEHGRAPHAGFRFTISFAMMMRCNSLVPSPIASNGASR